MEILVDTREKKPFKFLFSKGSVVTEQCLKTGDYSIRGHEDKITIDRKATSGELAMCFGSEWKRFQKELIRMQSFERAYIVCSFPLLDIEQFPKNSGIPRYRWRYLRIRPAFLIKRIREIEEDYGVSTVFCIDRNSAERTTHKLLREYYEQFTQNK